MRLPLLAHDFDSAAATRGTKRPRMAGKARLLAAGASVLALGLLNPSDAEAQNVPGVIQHADDTIAINLFELGEGEAAEFGAIESVSTPGGHALAEALVLCAGTATCVEAGELVQYARGVTSAANTAIIGDSLSISADAVAEGASATAAGYVQVGLWQLAAAEGRAQNIAVVVDELAIGADADAVAATGSAVAFAGVGAGVSQVASSIGIAGSAANWIFNSGELTVIADADAEALAADAAATAFVSAGLFQQANGQNAAEAQLFNNGNILVEADALAVAPNGSAAASASAAGIIQLAAAQTQQFASTFTSGGALIGTSGNTPSGPATAALSNNGVIHVDVDAAAVGGIDAEATAAVLGIGQLASGSDAVAEIVNTGSIHIDAAADVESAGTPRGVVFVSGITQVATAFGFSTVETIDAEGVLTYQLSSSPVGPAVAALINTATIAVAGDVNVVALGTGSMEEGLGAAFVDGLDQHANGNDAVALLDNRGLFSVAANVTVDSGNVSNAVAIATGIDQSATAYATQATVVFANGTTTPTTFTQSGTAAGPAAAALDNSGYLTVLASVDSHGDEVAFAGATASAVGQFAAGTEAFVGLDNSGIIASVGEVSSSGKLAFGGAASIGIQQAVQATDEAEAQLDNGGSIISVAEAEADGESGAFVNATAFGIAQNVFSDESAAAEIANSGTIAIAAIANAVAADTGTADQAIGFAAAHGVGQLAVGQQASVEFDNSGTFEMLAAVDAQAEDFALASAIASGAVQQVALGSAAGTGSATIGNSGSIEIGAVADAAAGDTALALAGVNSAVVQLVSAGQGGSANMDNSGSIALIAEAEALAAGGYTTDFASAQAFALGLNAAVTATATGTGATGFADVTMSNQGSISVHGVAHATGDGFARALGTGAFGMVGTANVWGNGSAEVTLTNDGSLSLLGIAEATGGHTANATGIAVAGMDASATSAGEGDAIAAVANTGELTLGADAHASAGTNALAVAIAIDGLQTTAHAGTGDALASIDNSGELHMIANATASALNAQAFAIVGGTFFTGAVFQSAAAMNGNASVAAENSGSISVVADALANGDVIASASAVGGPGINQFAFATSGDASVSMNNSGSLEFVAHAEANGANSAYADALFYNAVAQFGNSFGGQAHLQLANDGSISLAVVAEANGVAGAGALAIASHDIGQSTLVIGNDATVELANSGSIEIDVAALVEGGAAEATAVLATAFYQTAAAIGAGDAAAQFGNSGSIDLAVVASANSPDGWAGAHAFLDGAVSQYAGAGSSEYVYGSTEGGLTAITQNIFPTGAASLLLDNSGSIDISAVALAEGGTSAAADASGVAIEQFARGADASAALVNDGSMNIELGAMAEAEGNASAAGSLVGLVQQAAAAETTVHITATEHGGQVTDSVMTPVGTGLVSFQNSGTFELTGIASAEGTTGSADASIDVLGIDQSVVALDAQAAFSNGDEFTVGARAEANGGTVANADAAAVGYAVSGGAFALDFSNEGEFTVIAEAAADGEIAQANANAVGAVVGGDGALTGTIDNSGELLVKASAEAGAAGLASAQATGIRIGSNADGLHLTNSGVIAVNAITDGGVGQATGIGTFDTGSVGTAGLTITNDGGFIFARVSDDGGETWTRGTAIDLSAASASSVVNLLGNGGINGNIDLASGQSINVTGGETWLNGIINAECSLAGCGQGRLNIASGAALYLRHVSGEDAPSGAYLEQLNIASGGKLVLDLPTGSDPEAAYPRIVTGIANLDGTLVLRTGFKLFEDSYLFDNVIDADVRNGTFDSCGLSGDPALLDISCSYDSAGNVDLGIERIAFNAVDGLTRNQKAAGSGIEAVYDVGLGGAFGAMVEQLFTFGAEDYGAALGQLTGASYAAYLQSFNSLGVESNDLVDRASGCDRAVRAVSSLSCRDGKVRLWGQLDVSERTNDGDEEAPGYDADRLAVMIGGDVAVAQDAIVGAAIGKRDNRLKLRDGSRAEADGYQIAAYAAFDPGTYYAKVIGSFSRFDGDGSRSINWKPLGATLAGTLAGDPDVNLWTLGAHLGYRLPLGDSSLVTPFLNVDHSVAKLQSFDETGLEGANLAISGSTSSQTAVTLGAKWAAELGRIVPQAELGYRHRFGDLRTSVDAAFVAEDGSDFSIVSAKEARSALLAGLSVGSRAGRVELRAGYHGQFDGNATSHSVNFRITLPLGGN